MHDRGVIITSFFPLAIEKAEGKKRSILTAAAVTVLVLILGVFKYFNFFMSTVMSTVGKTWTTLDIILPVGISFYIFSAIGYLLDVSWGMMPAEKNILDIALFLSFFPKQVCGPIIKGREFLPQLKENRRITLKNIEAGIQIFVFGLFKKLVLADHLGVFVNDVYHAPSAFGTLTVWWAVFSTMLQLYFDFSGYSDMAIGMAKIFGYDIPRNFNLPFTARNISEFWDRWHISLSSWLNIYLFNPITVSMNRKITDIPKEKRKKLKNLQMYAALLITFLISGIWHGAGFTFIVWGLCHGVWSVLHSMYSNYMKQHYKSFVKNKSKFLTVLDILLTFFTVNVIQVFFNSDSLGKAFNMLKCMFTLHDGINQPYTWSFFAYAVLIVSTLIAHFHNKEKRSIENTEGFYPLMDLNTVKGLSCFFFFCGLTICLGYFGETQFIYGKF